MDHDVEPSAGRVLEPCRINQLRDRPLTPGPSPALGRGEPMSIEFLERHRVSSLYFAILSKGEPRMFSLQTADER